MNDDLTETNLQNRGETLPLGEETNGRDDASMRADILVDVHNPESLDS